ncbi:MAG: 4-hydroxy-tetrahydrodipicolinate reductase [Clostridiales bacterium]|jgi:4-hydroxy-tetrahydrodipicolinate reductase|nr:4-hydroxy-tetrahydrodipicolinate reductase [Clostridiales bacterium]
MIKLILHGCNGKMGQAVSSAAAADGNIKIVAGVDPYPNSAENSFPVYETLSQVKEEADVVLDFSVPGALPALLDYADKTSIPLVIATTGFTEQDLKAIERQAQKTAIFRAANMSVGINLMYDLIRRAAVVLDDDFDIEIVEKHHNQKMDAPSGTAYALADAINSVFLGSKHYKFGRHSKVDKRSKNEIGIHAVRGGTIAGEHTVIFAGQDEILEITHTALSRRIFALGALNAVKYMAGKKKGLYDMADALLDQNVVTNLYTNNEQVMITINSLPDEPVIIADIFSKLGSQGINVDMISQTAPVSGHINLSFTLPGEDLEQAVKAIEDVQKNHPEVRTDIFEEITQLTVEGLGMERQSGVAARVFEALARQDIRIKLITTSETKISLVIDRTNEKAASEAIIAAFDL